MKVLLQSGNDQCGDVVGCQEMARVNMLLESGVMASVNMLWSQE